MRQSNQNKRLADIAAKIPKQKTPWQQPPRVAGKPRIVAIAERIDWAQRMSAEHIIPDSPRERLANIATGLPEILEKILRSRPDIFTKELQDEQMLYVARFISDES